MKFLFFDCETNGLPKNYNASYTELDNWPRIISLAYIVAEAPDKIIYKDHNLIKPDGWTIPREDFWIRNGYFTENFLEKGLPVAGVLRQFLDCCLLSDALVAHNLNFDHRVVWAEIIRAGMTPRSGMPKYCTMQLSTRHCSSKLGGKWPKLNELHQVLFKKDFEGAHDASADVEACMNCFFELVRLNVIQPQQMTA